MNRGLLTQLAQESGGLAAFLSREDNLARQALAFRRKLQTPAATDLKIDFGGLEVYDVEPVRLPALFHGMPVRVYGRYRGAGTVKVGVQAEVGGKPIRREVELAFPERDAANPQIERMWAAKRIERLLADVEAGGARNAGIDAIARLGERYSITSEYTSFIVLENDAEYARWKIDRANDLRLARDRKAQEELAAKLETIRAKARADLGPAAAAAPALATAQSAASGTSSAASQPGPASSQSVPAVPQPRSRDIDFGFHGGGALDPISGVIMLCVAALGLCARRRGTKGARG